MVSTSKTEEPTKHSVIIAASVDKLSQTDIQQRQQKFITIPPQLVKSGSHTE